MYITYCDKPASWHHIFVKPTSNQNLQGKCWFLYNSIHRPDGNGGIIRANCRRQKKEHVKGHPFINLRIYGEKIRRSNCTKIMGHS